MKIGEETQETFRFSFGEHVSFVEGLRPIRGRRQSQIPSVICKFERLWKHAMWFVFMQSTTSSVFTGICRHACNNAYVSFANFFVDRKKTKSLWKWEKKDKLSRIYAKTLSLFSARFGSHSMVGQGAKVYLWHVSVGRGVTWLVTATAFGHAAASWAEQQKGNRQCFADIRDTLTFFLQFISQAAFSPITFHKMKAVPLNQVHVPLWTALASQQNCQHFVIKPPQRNSWPFA